MLKLFLEPDVRDEFLLNLDSDSFQQVGKPGIVPERIELRFDFKPDHFDLMDLIGFFQPFKC